MDILSSATGKLTRSVKVDHANIFRYLFAADDGPEIMKNNVERLYHVMHGTKDTMKKYFCGPGAMRSYLTDGGEEIELRSYAKDPTFKAAFIERMRRDGFDGPQCWYKATVRNNQHESDKGLPEGVDKVEVPVLYIGGKDDAVCRPESMFDSIQKGWLPKLEQAEMKDAAHWTPYEASEEVTSDIRGWLKKNYA